MQKIGVLGQVISEILAQLCSDDFIQILRDNLPHNASFWQLGRLDVVLSEYPDKLHNFDKFNFLGHHTLELYCTYMGS